MGVLIRVMSRIALCLLYRLMNSNALQKATLMRKEARIFWSKPVVSFTKGVQIISAKYIPNPITPAVMAESTLKEKKGDEEYSKF